MLATTALADATQAKAAASDPAEAALTQAQAELGEVSPAYIEAKDAFDRAVAERVEAEKALQDYMAEQKFGGKHDVGTVKQTIATTTADGNALPQNGDGSVAPVAVTAAAGLSMVGVAEVLRRRRAQQQR